MKTLRWFWLAVMFLPIAVVGFDAHAGKKKTFAQSNPIGRSSISPAVASSNCTPPGTTVVTDPASDQNGAPAANQQLDIQSLSIAEQCFADGLDKLTFTLKVADLSSVPANAHWKVRFVFGSTTYYVEMLSDQNRNVSYGYGTIGTTTTPVGSADEGSFAADGTIVITVANSKVGGPTVGQSITTIQAQTQLLVGAAGTGLLAGIDSTSTAAAYTLVGHASCTCPAPTPTPTPQPTAGPGIPRFQNYTPPSTAVYNGGEPSIGTNWMTGNAMYLASFAALRISFDDCPSPARDIWTNTNALGVASLDPILFTDHMNGAHRTFVSQLTGQDSQTTFTDDDGASYLPSQGGGIPSGVDHQTIGAGPYNATSNPPPPPHPVYPNAVYYCSQEAATAFCARSDDGGATFGAGVPIYSLVDCVGIHGHVKVAPDGTAYVPNRSCGGKAAVVVSKDNGLTWSVKPVATSSTTGFLVDPSVGIGTNTAGQPGGQPSNTIYLGYQASNSHPRVAVSHDQGNTWINDQDVGAGFGIQNSTFPELVAGDDNRAAYAFLGTTIAGDYTNPAFRSDAPWHLYIATTYDGGATWTTIDATPNDPVQRGSICNLGTTACMRTPNDRNLLDFMDETIDAQGRVLVGYPDGCIGPCVNGSRNSYSAFASIARQSGGKTLFAANDPLEPAVPKPPRVDGVVRDGSGVVHVTWSVPDNGGSPITGYKIYRRVDPDPYGAPLATLPADTTKFDDGFANIGTPYFYKVTATNAQGESLNCGEFQITAPPATNPCIGTGAVVNTDPTGDQLLAPQNADLDIQTVSIAEPVQGDGINRLIFTMKVANLTTLLPDRQWVVVWTPPTAPSIPGTDRYFVRMSSNAGTPAAVTFDYGVVTASGNAAVVQGTADAGSFDQATGIIQIAVANSKVGNPAAGASLNVISGRNFAGTGDGTIGKGSAIDSTGDGSYTLVGNAACSLAPVPVSAVSRKIHGAAGQFDVDLPLAGNPGIECRTGGASGDHQVVITFPAAVTIDHASVTSGSGSVASTSVDGSVVTVNLTGVGNAQTITITLFGAQMGSNLGDVHIPMGILLGDTTGNRQVNSSDIAQTQSQSGRAVDVNNFREDVTVNGQINSSDIALVQSKSGTGLP